MIAVNDGDSSGSVTFQFPSEPASIRELSENRVIEPNARGFTDEFKPLVVHLYRIELR